MIDIRNIDCMKLMAEYPDKHFDLAIVDPPYGINRAGQQETFTKNAKHKRKYYEDKGWDRERPTTEYWKELFRVSKNQIVFGANYFTEYLPPSMGWIFWDKGQELTMSDGELIFTSFEKAMRRKIINRASAREDGTIHPTQKPIQIYKFCLDYAKATKEWKVLDTHLGSGSSAIACHYLGCNFVGCEIDIEYFEGAKKNIKEHTIQMKLL